MNGNPTIMFSPLLSFLLVGGLIVLAMLMSRRRQGSHRAGFGWWVGLGLLLAVVSVFLGFNKLRVSPVTEERHTGRFIMNKAMEEMKEGIQTGAHAIQEGLSEARRHMEEAQKTMTSVTSGRTESSKNKKSGSTSVATTSFVPKSSVQWTVDIKGRERRQNRDDVTRSLNRKAVESINRFVIDRLPIKSVWVNAVDEAWLTDNGILPGKIEFQEEDIPRSGTELKDSLYGGTMLIVLPPEVQQSLMEMGFKKLETVLLDDKFEGQSIIFACLLAVTGFAAVLGTVKTINARRARAA